MAKSDNQIKISKSNTISGEIKLQRYIPIGSIIIAYNFLSRELLYLSGWYATHLII
jgi:hypothetical protein